MVSTNLRQIGKFVLAHTPIAPRYRGNIFILYLSYHYIVKSYKLIALKLQISENITNGLPERGCEFITNRTIEFIALYSLSTNLLFKSRTKAISGVQKY